MRPSPLRLVAAAALLAAAAGGAHTARARVLPAPGALASGLRLDEAPVPIRSDLESFVAARAKARLERRVRVTHDGEVLVDASLAELGATIDTASAVRSLRAVAHEGDIWTRLDEALEARAGKRATTLTINLPSEALAERLVPRKLALDSLPEDARYDFVAGHPTDHQTGRIVDVEATWTAIHSRLRDSTDAVIDIPLSVRSIPPAATRAAVAAIDRSQVVGSYRTRYAFRGRDAGRAQNVRRAAEGIDGVVLMPRQTISFNARVGPRSEARGFAKAGEIYKGELRMGVGGGTCQVASTLHAAAYLGGLDVPVRSPHSRPSGYIPIGLDATVSYPHVDLHIRNPFDFAVVVRAREAQPGELLVELRGARPKVEVDLATRTVGVHNYKRKIRKVHFLEPGRVIRKQKGRRGVTVEKVRRFVDHAGTPRAQTTVDRYPPTDEIYMVGPEVDVESELPPMPPGVTLAKR